MGLNTKLVIFGFLVVATTLEVTGDAIVRIGLGRPAGIARGVYFLAGAVLLFGYGLALNLAPIEFNRVVGIYLATLFVVWQVITFFAFRTLPTAPVMLGGVMIVAGGLIVSFWKTA